MSNSVKFFIVTLLLLTAASCQSSEDLQTTDIFNEKLSPAEKTSEKTAEKTAEDVLYKDFFSAVCNTPAEEGSLFFFGSSPVFAEKNLEEKNALQNSLYSALIFNGVKLNFISSGTGRRLTVITDSGVEKSIEESLDPFDLHSNRFGYFGIYRIKKSGIPGLRYTADYSFPEIRNSIPIEKPEWIYRLPEAEGYMFSTGASGRYSSISDSIKKADMNALEEMMKQKITGIITTGIEYSAAEISGFYIIKRWWAPEMDYFYSLAAAPE